MIQRANGRTTVPQIFIGAVHVGGSDDLHALDYEAVSTRFSPAKETTHERPARHLQGRADPDAHGPDAGG